MAHVAATRSERWAEPLAPTAVTDLLASPQHQDTRKDDEAGCVDREYSGRADPRNDETSDGGTDRAGHVHADGPQRGGRRKLRTRNELGNERLVRRRREGGPHPKRERQHQQQRRMHLASCCERGQDQAHCRHVDLDRNQHAPAIERICQHAAWEGEEHDRKRAGGLHESDERRRTGLVHQE